MMIKKIKQLKEKVSSLEKELCAAYLDIDRRNIKIRFLEGKVKKLEGLADFLERENAKLRIKEPSTFDRMVYQKQKDENEELRDRAKKAEDERRFYKTLSDDFLKLNRDLRNELSIEQMKNGLAVEIFGKREKSLLNMNEKLAVEVTELKFKLGEEPSKAITIDGTRVDSKMKQPEPKKKKT